MKCCVSQIDFTSSVTEICNERAPLLSIHSHALTYPNFPGRCKVSSCITRAAADGLYWSTIGYDVLDVRALIVFTLCNAECRRKTRRTLIPHCQ